MISQIPYLGGYNDAGSGYELPIDRDARPMKAPKAPLTQMQKDTLEEARKTRVSTPTVEPAWPAKGAAFAWVRDMVNADVIIELRALCDKRLRELGCMR